MTANGTSRFQDVIRAEDELRALIGRPSARASNKVIDRIDRHTRPSSPARPSSSSHPAVPVA